MMNQQVVNSKIYHLVYRGVAHQKQISSIETKPSNLEIKYRGVPYQKSNHVSVLKPESLFHYRGTTYVRSLQLLCL